MCRRKKEMKKGRRVRKKGEEGREGGKVRAPESPYYAEE